MYIFLPVASGVNVTYRIICDTAIPIEALPIPRVRHEGIRLQEPSQGGIILPRAIVVEAQGRLLPLAGELVARRRDAGGEVRPTLRRIAPFRDFATAAVGGDCRAAQVVAEEHGVLLSTRIAICLSTCLHSLLLSDSACRGIPTPHASEMIHGARLCRRAPCLR